MKKYTLTSIILICFTYAFGQSDNPANKEMKAFSSLQNYDTYSVSSTNYDVNFYRCEWTVDPAVRYISGSVTTYFTMVGTGNNIIMDLYNTLKVDSIIFRKNRINFEQTTNNALQVNFPTTLNSGVKDSIQIYYQGPPPSNGFGSFNLTSHNNVPVLFTLSEPYGAPTWWPCKDSNSDKPDSIDIIIHYPSNYVSSSNGLPFSESTEGTAKTTYWKHRYPIAPYLVAIAVTNYDVDNDAVQLGGKTMPVVMYSYPENASVFKSATSVAKTALQGFSSLLIEYPFSKERYAQTQFSWGGGMEHQTNSFIVSPAASLVSHELGHQWFGDRITCGSWSDLWLNEGFATYMEYLFQEFTAPAGRIPLLQSWTAIVTSSTSGSVFIVDTNNINRLFDSRLTYKKGGYLLHMLRGKLGDSTFFRGLRRYLTDPALAYKSARTADLKRNLEAESNQNLDEFFKDWFYGEGYPNYNATWNQQSNNLVRLQLNQTTSHPSVGFYEMAVPIQLKGIGRDTIIKVNHIQDGQIFTLNPGFTVDTVIIDPQLWILSKQKIAKRVSTPIGIEGVAIYPNPATTKLTIALPSSAPAYVTVEIFNSVGQKMYEAKSVSTIPIEINTMSFSTGIHLLRITGLNNYKYVQKFMISR